MTVDGEKPLVADSARGLGVRVGGGTNTDIPVKANDDVEAETGGMSVAPSMRDLPLHRIPRRLKDKVPFATGNNVDACWAFGDGAFIAGPLADGLMLRPDSSTHANVEPRETMPLATYRSYLAKTRDAWAVDER
jgi:hypothetical protein